jgi:hypothetical protein
MALEGTMTKFYRGLNVIIVATIDGVEHTYHFTKDLVVHGGKSAGVSPLDDLREGETVVVHYATSGNESSLREVDIIGDEGLEITEGKVIDINRSHGQITVRYDNGKTEKFSLTPRANAEKLETAGPDDGKVIIYYSDEHGVKVAHFFKKVSK